MSPLTKITHIMPMCGKSKLDVSGLRPAGGGFGRGHHA
jgi:hypothetical protein